MTQKFHYGDLVRIAADLGPSMSHFEKGCDAIVVYSYGDRYGLPGSGGGYSVHIRWRGEISWYEEGQLTLIKKAQGELIETWRKEEREVDEQAADLDWIFANGENVLKGARGATIETLGECCGVYDLWGAHGEGVTYHFNAVAILTAAKPFLLSGDKAGWLSYCNQKSAA